MNILTVVGARPQFVKAAQLSRLLRSKYREVLVHTGQHYDKNMSAYFFEQLQIPRPDYELGVRAQHQGEQTAQMMIRLEQILLHEKPELVLVYGDTNSTLAGSLTAAKLHIPIAHVEAGLRSFNQKMPEEINRMMTDHLSTLLFCPTITALQNLKNEGIDQHIYLVGDIMYDSVLYYKQMALNRVSIAKKFNVKPTEYILATIHRAENTDHKERLENIFQALTQLKEPVVLPLHPRTKNRLKHWQLDHYLTSPNLKVIEPVHYLDMLALQSQAKMILTDSGGVQKEAYMLQVPCITLREETEWTETVKEGWNHLVGSDPERILSTVRNLQIPKSSPPLFGDGRTAEKIVDIIIKFL